MKWPVKSQHCYLANVPATLVRHCNVVLACEKHHCKGLWAFQYQDVALAHGRHIFCCMFPSEERTGVIILSGNGGIQPTGQSSV